MNRRDDGLSLILVIVLVFVVGIVASASLSLATTGLRASSITSQEQEERTQNADSALQAAITQIRQSDYIATKLSNGTPVPCPPLTYPGPTPAQDVRVTCEPRPGSGATEVAITRAPAYGLQATQVRAANGEAGIVQEGDGISVLGDVHSASSITTEPGPILVDGTATAVTGCTGSVSDPKNCTAGSVPVPDYTQPVTGAIPRNVPACPGDGRTIQFQPGLYDNATELSSLMNTCSASTFWFPGAVGGAKYFFDFRDGEPGYPAGQPLWNITAPGVRIVTGGTSAPGAPATVTIPGSCTSPLRRDDNNGVQFLFGGRSQLRMSAGQLELCGPGDAAGGEPPIAIYGGDAAIGTAYSAGNNTPPTGAVPGILKLATTTDPPSCSAPVACFSQVNRIKNWDASYSAADIAPKKKDPKSGWRASITLTGYSPAQAQPASTVPAGATLNWAKLYVRHRERPTDGDPAVAADDIDITVTVNGLATPIAATVPSSATAAVATVDLFSASLKQHVEDNGFTGASVGWTVQQLGTRTLDAEIDSVQIAMGWTVPTAFRPQTTLISGANCVGRPTGAYPAPGSCPFVQTSSTMATPESPTRFHIQGTAYARAAVFDFGHSGVPAPLVTSGLIARAARFTTTPDPGYRGPVVIRPYDLQVLLRAYVCPAGETCPTGDGPVLDAPWEQAGTAVVEYDDISPITAGDRGVRILKRSPGH